MASSKKILLHLEEPKAPPGSTLPVKWASFSQKYGEEHPSAVQESKLEIEGTGPVIYLNQDIAYLYTVMHSPGYTGNKAVLRMNLERKFASMHWTSLLTQTLINLRDSDDDDSGADIEQLKEWEQEILKKWCLYIILEASNTDEAIEKLVDKVSSSAEFEILIRDLSVSVESFIKSYETLPRLVEHVGGISDD